MLIVILLVLFSEVFAFEFTVVAPGLPEIAAAFDTTRVNLVMAVPLLGWRVGRAVAFQMG